VNRTMLRSFFLSLPLAVCCFGSVITNVNITARFHSPTDDTPGVQPFDPVTAPAGAAAVTRVSWGEPPVLGGPQSGYVFAAINQPAVPNIAGPINVNPPALTPYFTLGTFTHNNFVVDNPYLTTVLLDVIMSFDIDGNPSGQQTFTFLIEHTETPNQVETGAGICPFLTPVGAECTDRVNLGGGGVPQSFTLGGVTYTLDLAFQNGGSPISTFITNEGQSNNALLVGRFSASADTTVPEPGTLAMASLALLGLAAARFRKARA
jgi:PEP-CTERM motif